MHPIERLRALARADWLDPQTIAVEAADAIGDAARWLDMPTAVSIARRLLAWHSACGPLWYATGRILQALDPAEEAAAVVEDLLADPTPLMLDAALPEGAEPLVVGDGPGLSDIAADSGLWIGEPPAHGSYGRRRFASPGSARQSPHQVRAVVERASHVLIGVQALGPCGLVARRPAALAASAAASAHTPVWAIAGIGTPVDGRLWDGIEGLLRSDRVRPTTTVRSDAWWDDTDTVTAVENEIVDLGRVTFVCGPDGLVPPEEAAADPPTVPADLLDCLGSEPF